MPDAESIDVESFRFRGPEDRLSRFPTADTSPFEDEESARESTRETAVELARHQLMLEAHGRYGLLVTFQGMDAAGKDEAIHHVLSTVDPEGAVAESFSSMHAEEARHDYLWRSFRALPGRGEMAIFNRSYYERVTADRVEPTLLEDQSLPPDVMEKSRDGSLWQERLRQIQGFERYLVENGIELVKLFFHVSADEQRRRLLERTERPEKRWDFSKADVVKREDWEAFGDAYEAAFRATSTDRAPWHIIPADRKWYSQGRGRGGDTRQAGVPPRRFPRARPRATSAPRLGPNPARRRQLGLRPSSLLLGIHRITERQEAVPPVERDLVRLPPDRAHERGEEGQEG